MGVIIWYGLFFLTLAAYAFIKTINAKTQWFNEGKRDAIRAYNLTHTIPKMPDKFNPDYKKEYVEQYKLGFISGLDEIKKSIENKD